MDIDTVENKEKSIKIGLQHILNLQEAAALPHNALYSTNEDYLVEVSIVLDLENECVIVSFLDEDWDDEVLQLSDYKQLFSYFAIV